MPYYKVEIVFRSEPGQLDSVTLTVNASTEHDAEIAGVGRALELFPQRAIQVVGVALDVELRDLTEMGIAAYAQRENATPDHTAEHDIPNWRARCQRCGTTRAMLALRPCLPVEPAKAADPSPGKPPRPYKIEETFAAMRSKVVELEEEIRLLVLERDHLQDYVRELEGEREHVREQAEHCGANRALCDLADKLAFDMVVEEHDLRKLKPAALMSWLHGKIDERTREACAVARKEERAASLDQDDNKSGVSAR